MPVVRRPRANPGLYFNLVGVTEGGGGGSVLRQGLRSKLRPLTLLYTIIYGKGNPFVYLQLTNGTPFTYLV